MPHFSTFFEKKWKNSFFIKKMRFFKNWTKSNKNIEKNKIWKKLRRGVFFGRAGLGARAGETRRGACPEAPGSFMEVLARKRPEVCHLLLLHNGNLPGSARKCSTLWGQGLPRSARKLESAQTEPHKPSLASAEDRCRFSCFFCNFVFFEEFEWKSVFFLKLKNLWKLC